MLRGLALMALVCLWGIPAFSSGQAEPAAEFTILYTISNQGFVDACG